MTAARPGDTVRQESENMLHVTIDNRPIDVEPGTTILEAARRLDIAIPTLCHREGVAPLTTCYLCVVRVDDQPNFVPACATRAQDGMRVDASSDEVTATRQMCLELLLSDHVGACSAPCTAICPAHMNIPRMIRQIAAGDLQQAIATVKKDIALPAVLGRICPAPCERGCRRGEHDEPVGIMLLKRYVADADLDAEVPYLPERAAATGKRVAVVGAGPTGLAAAYYLTRAGHACTVFDDHDKPGGMLRKGVARDLLPEAVLDAEIATVLGLGVELRTGTRVEPANVPPLRQQYDAVVLAVGKTDPDTARQMGVTVGKRGIEVNAATLQTSQPGVFAGGDAVRPTRRTVSSVAAGKAMAVAVGQFLRGDDVTGPATPFNSAVGKLMPGEIDQFMREAGDTPRHVPDGEQDSGYAAEPAIGEARRCLHCDCRKNGACKLQDYAGEYGAKQRRFRADERRPFTQTRQHANVIYEPGKCIRCGLCVRITRNRGESLGLTFIGRGFDVRVGVPFDESLKKALTDSATACVDACPTGALAALRM